MPPRNIVLIRHGEKGDHQVRLSRKGQIRAQYLTTYFHDHPAGVGYPDVIFAQRQQHRHSSDRCRETVQPLADHLGLAIDTSFSRHDVEAIGALLRSHYHRDKTVLVCLEHLALVSLAKLLGYDVESWSTNPMKHHADEYDVTWVISPADKSLQSFRQFAIIKHHIRYMFSPDILIVSINKTKCVR